MATPKTTFEVPYREKPIDKIGFFSRAWEWFFRSVWERLVPLGIENSITLFDGITIKSIPSTEFNPTNDTVTETAHGFYTGIVGQFLTGGTLPSELSLSTDYYLIVIDDDTFKIAETLTDALTGVAINFISSGSGNHGFLPRANVTGMRFDKRIVSQAIVEFLIQRVTTGSGALEYIESGAFIVAYRPTSATWSLTELFSPTPDDSAVFFFIDDNGQVQYRSSAMTGTRLISKLHWRARTLAGKHVSYSSIGGR